ncbi:hypothetical protein EMIT079MI2_20259 [Bacillus sp. IT-79MI2]
MLYKKINLCGLAFNKNPIKYYHNYTNKPLYTKIEKTPSPKDEGSRCLLLYGINKIRFQIKL